MNIDTFYHLRYDLLLLSPAHVQDVISLIINEEEEIEVIENFVQMYSVLRNCTEGHLTEKELEKMLGHFVALFEEERFREEFIARMYSKIRDSTSQAVAALEKYNVAPLIAVHFKQFLQTSVEDYDELAKFIQIFHQTYTSYGYEYTYDYADIHHVVNAFIEGLNDSNNTNKEKLYEVLEAFKHHEYVTIPFKSTPSGNVCIIGEIKKATEKKQNAYDTYSFSEFCDQTHELYEYVE